MVGGDDEWYDRWQWKWWMRWSGDGDSGWGEVVEYTTLVRPMLMDFFLYEGQKWLHPLLHIFNWQYVWR